MSTCRRARILHNLTGQRGIVHQHHRDNRMSHCTTKFTTEKKQTNGAINAGINPV